MSADGSVVPIIAAMANRARGVWPLEPLTLDTDTWVRCSNNSSAMGRVEGAMYAIVIHFKNNVEFGDDLIRELNQALEKQQEEEKLAVFDAAVLVAAYAASVFAPVLQKDKMDDFLAAWIQLHLDGSLHELSAAERNATAYMRPPSAYVDLLLTRACLQKTRSALFEGRNVRSYLGLWPQLALNCPRWLINMLSKATWLEPKDLAPMWRYYFNTCLRLPSLHAHKQLDAWEWLKHSPQKLMKEYDLRTEKNADMRLDVLAGFECLVRKMLDWKAPLMKYERQRHLIEAFCADLQLLVPNQTLRRFAFAPICKYDGLAQLGRPTPEPFDRTIGLFRALAPQCMIISTTATKTKIDSTHLIVCHQSVVPAAYVRVFVFLLRCLNAATTRPYTYSGEHREYVHGTLLAEAPVVVIPCIVSMCVQVALAEQGKYDHQRLQNIVQWLIEDLAAYPDSTRLTLNIPPIMQLELIRQQFCGIHDALFLGELPPWYKSNRVAILVCARWAPAWCYERLLLPYVFKKKGVMMLSPWELAGAMVDQLRLQFLQQPDKQRWFKRWFEPNAARFVDAIKAIISPAQADCFVAPQHSDDRLLFWRAVDAMLKECVQEESPEGITLWQYSQKLLPFFKPMHDMYKQEFERMGSGT